MKELSKKEKKFNEKSDREVEELYDSFLAKAHREVTWNDIPEEADYQFYQWLSFEQQHLLGQYYTKIWSHAGTAANKTIDDLRFFKNFFICMELLAIAAEIITAVMRMSGIFFTVSVLMFLIFLSFFEIVSCILDTYLDRRRDVLCTAARYKAMCELLEKKFSEK